MNALLLFYVSCSSRSTAFRRGLWNECIIAVLCIVQFEKYGLPPRFWKDEAGKERVEYKKLILNWDEAQTTDMIARFKARGGVVVTSDQDWNQ